MLSYFKYAIHIILHVHSEKSPGRPMLFYSTSYWHQFWVQFVVWFKTSQYVLHFYYTLYDGKYDCKITTH